MLKHLFSRKNRQPETVSDPRHPLVKAMDDSTLLLITHQVFKHYYDPQTLPNQHDPAWQNQGIFFWEEHEPFERQSLPPAFREYAQRFFIVEEIPSGISVVKNTVLPWFGMPGNGTKYAFTDNQGHIALEPLFARQSLRYIVFEPLTAHSSGILHDRSRFFLLLDHETMRYDPTTDRFFLNEHPVSLGEAWQKGSVRVVRFINAGDRP